ncbi:sulfatase family protein [Pelagicoccus mobilis]|uniref:Sulfatase-like hydrolase/transferase n=1 Tax=Pelagicoccus mobilis TaxID=415221 RepID=A0A934RVX1_9BACT|nr:sulfatase-like hydrolase/transferase [Pelagicoccus mobilis]MBK1875776.1 sulfatase-like hydrolase/transferase [Pelagicoccus mobilis]
MIKVLFGILSLASATTITASDRPNVIVIVADDLGYADVGFHDVVAEDIHTPNLDRLANSGVVFRNAYASSPICSNSRLAMTTGRYQQRWGAYYYGQGGMPTTEFSIAEMMKEAGYRTKKVGKTHLNNGPKQDPMKHGFDSWIGFTHHSWEFNLISDKDVDAYEKKQAGSIEKARMIGIGPLTRNSEGTESFENTTTTEVFGAESIEFIEQERDEPFYLQLEFNAVHTPLTSAPNEELRRKYGIPARPFDRDAEVWEYPHWDPVANPDYKKWYSDIAHLAITDPYGRKIYLAHLDLMDSVIGEILDTLDKKGIRENTIVFFSSDNGGSDQSYANNGDINAYKYCLMDGGIKVPMVLSWPEGFGETSIEALVTHRDLYATLSEITGIAPKNPLDGKSLLPLIKGDVKEIHAGEKMFWDSGPKRVNWVARDGDWKLVYNGEPKTYHRYELGADGLVKPELIEIEVEQGMQLYNLKDDPNETKDLASMNPERVDLMKKMYTEWRSQMADPISGRKAK